MKNRLRRLPMKKLLQTTLLFALPFVPDGWLPR